MASYFNMPFRDPNELFSDVLYYEFIEKSINWIETSSCGEAFGSQYGSYWEAAYILEYLLDVRKIISKRDGNDDSILSIELMCNKIASFLIDIENNNEITNWDGNTWDTSVVANALLYYIDSFGLEISSNNPICGKLLIILPKVIKWLYDQFIKYEAIYSQYSFGPVDYSRILFLFIYIYRSKYRNRLLQPVNLKISDLVLATHELMRHIDKSKVCETVSFYNESTKLLTEEEIINWGDSFITAETSEAVSNYLLFLTEINNKKYIISDHDVWTSHVYSILKKAMRWMETVQSSEGMWGAHDDTIRCLTSYLATIDALKQFERTPQKSRLANNNNIDWIGVSECEEHKVFKAIRWLFDPKQRFVDGSYLHTSFLSVFFFEALISIYNHWSFSNGKTIYKIYDEVFWMSPARTTQEKGQLVETEIAIERKTGEIKELRQQKRVFMLASITLAVISAGILIGLIIGLISIDVSLKENNVEGLALIFTLVVFIFSTVGARYFSSQGE